MSPGGSEMIALITTSEMGFFFFLSCFQMVSHNKLFWNPGDWLMLNLCQILCCWWLQDKSFIVRRQGKNQSLWALRFPALQGASRALHILQRKSERCQHFWGAKGFAWKEQGRKLDGALADAEEEYTSPIDLNRFRAQFAVAQSQVAFS